MRKGMSIQTMLGVGVIVFVAALVALNITGFTWPEFGALMTDDGCTLVKPQFGRIECEPVSSVQTKNAEAFLTYGEDYGNRPFYRVECGDNENSPSCDYYVRCDCNPSDPSCYFYYQASDNSNCRIGTDNWCKQGVTGGQESRFLSNKQLGTTIQIGSCKGTIGTLYAGEVGTYFVPYGLKVYEYGGAFRYNTQSCSLSDWGFNDRTNVMVNCGGVPGCSKEYQGDYIEFDDWVNYLASWDYVVEGLDSRYIENYNGQQAYCIAGKIYSLKEMDTVGGCYAVQSSVIANEECCPGMQAGNQYCGDDFEWHTQSSGEKECYTDLQCYVSTSTGTEYIPDYSTQDLDIVKWECVSNKCVITDRKYVQCVPPNVGCPAGQVCNPNKGYICENQIGPGIACGDGVCSSPYEDIINCPQDCTNPNEWDLEFLWIVVLAVLGAGIGYAAGKWLGLGIGAAIGGIIGLIIYWYLGLAWWQQLALGIGGLVGGGITLYLFGGAIASFILMVIIIWRKK